MPRLNPRNILAAVRRAGSPRRRGQGAVQELEGLSPLGTAARIEELDQLIQLAREWKLHAVDAYKRKLRGEVGARNQ